MSNDQKDGADAKTERSRRNTPILTPPTHEDTLKRIARVRRRLDESRRMHERTDELLVEMGQLVGRGGSDDQVKQLDMRLALHFEELSEFMRDDMSPNLASLGRAFWRRSQT